LKFIKGEWTRIELQGIWEETGERVFWLCSGSEEGEKEIKDKCNSWLSKYFWWG